VQPFEWLDTATPVTSAPLPEAAVELVSGTIGRNETAGSLLSRIMEPQSVARVLAAARPVHDLARITVGRPFGIAIGPDGLFQAFTYGIDELRTLRVAREDDDQLVAELVKREYDTRTAVVASTIESSLFGAIESSGEGDQLAVDLADVFQWDIDFNTEIQGGDSFRVLVEKHYLDGRLARYGRILGAEFARGSRVLQAVYHEGAAGPGYYDADGRPLRKAFLRSPLRFTRISSRFSRSRLHPVLGIRRPHLGIDYAAPKGTPVQAAGSGIVELAGWQGGYGKTVRVRHPNGYETLYGHLSRIDVRRGQRVAQGTRIGAVGSTGLSTGPHLDYRMSRGGSFIDPLRLPALSAEPIAAAERPAFLSRAREVMQQLTPPVRTALAR
jgi:murein DD-endopeptidase MepM/ murein hydrolase activator NlpD